MSQSEMPPSSSPLDPFWEHLRRFRWLAVALIGLGTFPPILQFYLSVGPPWPHRTATATFSTVALWAMMIWTYGIWHNAPQTKLKSRLNRFLILTVVFFAAFTCLLAFFVVDAPTKDNQISKGFNLRAQWVELLEKGTLPDGTPIPAKSEQDLLRANEWDPYALYPAWTVDLIRFALLGTWILGFASLAALTSVFILLQEKKAASSA